MGMTRIVVEGKFGGFARECVAGIKHTSAELQLCLNAMPRCVAVLCKFGGVCRLTVGADTGEAGDDSAWADMLGVGAFFALGHNCDLAACHAFCQSVSSEKGVSSLPSLMYDCVVSVSGSLKRGFDKDASIKR